VVGDLATPRFPPGMVGRVQWPRRSHRSGISFAKPLVKPPGKANVRPDSVTGNEPLYTPCRVFPENRVGENEGDPTFRTYPLPGWAPSPPPMSPERAGFGGARRRS
jgi:hypothetical protein